MRKRRHRLRRAYSCPLRDLNLYRSVGGKRYGFQRPCAKYLGIGLASGCQIGDFLEEHGFESFGLFSTDMPPTAAGHERLPRQLENVLNERSGICVGLAQGSVAGYVLFQDDTKLKRLRLPNTAERRSADACEPPNLGQSMSRR